MKTNPKKYLHKSILVIVVFLSVFRALTSATGTENEKIILDHADTLRTKGFVRHMLGNVQLHKENQTLNADRVLYDVNYGMVNLSGHVVITEPDQVLTSRRITYYEQSGDYESAGNVEFLKADSVKINCNFANFSSMDSLLRLFGDVRIENLRNGAIIKGDNGIWNDQEKKAFITGNPAYLLPDDDSTSTDTLVIKSLTIEYFHRDNSALFIGDVDLQKGDLLAISDSLFHQPDSGQTSLTGAPVIWQSIDQLSGQSIYLFINDGALDSIEVINEAIILTEAHEESDLLNRLAGDYLKITMLDDSSRIVHVEGDSQGEYYIWDEQKVYQGVNLSAADIIEIEIINEEVSKISLIGKTSGAFYPPGMEPDNYVNREQKKTQRKIE